MTKTEEGKMTRAIIIQSTKGVELKYVRVDRYGRPTEAEQKTIAEKHGTPRAFTCILESISETNLRKMLNLISTIKI